MIVVITICAHRHFDGNDLYNKAETEVVREEYYQVLEMIVVAKSFGPQEKERDQRRRFLYMALVCPPAVTRAGKGLQSRPANAEAADTRNCFDQCMFQSIRTRLPEYCAFLFQGPWVPFHRSGMPW